MVIDTTSAGDKLPLHHGTLSANPHLIITRKKKITNEL